MEKLFIYAKPHVRSDTVYTPNIDFMKSLGYKCMDTTECPKISEYLEKNNIQKCACMIHLVDYSFKYMFSNEDFIKSNNYVYIYYLDLHPITKKKDKNAMRIKSLRMVMESPNTYVYGGIIYNLRLYYPFFPENKIIYDIYNGINDDFLLDEGINEEPRNVVLITGAANSYYPARNKMLKLDIDGIERFKPRDPTIIGKKYMNVLRNNLCCFACSACNYTPYLVAKFFEIPASGALLLAHGHNVQKHLDKLGFVDGENYIACTIKNMEQKVRYILNPDNRKEVNRIRRNGYKFAINYHKLTDRMRAIDDIIVEMTYPFFYKRYLCIETGHVYRKPKSLAHYKKSLISFEIGINESSDPLKMDKYCMPVEYVSRPDNDHFDCTKRGETDAQLEVYQYAKKVMEQKGFKKVADIGCGVAGKLMRILGEYETIGFEREPSISYLREKFPDRKWVEDQPNEFNVEKMKENKNCDLVISCDVIEHIPDPDELVDFMKSFDCKYFIISTPCRRECVLKHGVNPNGPPKNKAHVREWTFDEFKMYLSKHFKVIRSFLGRVQTTCQWHLCERYPIE